MWAVGMAKVKWQAKGGQTHSLLNKALQATQPADSPPGTGLKTTTATSWPASQQNNSRRRCRPASRRAVQVGGGSAVVLAARKAGADLPNRLYRTYHLCLSLNLPTPLILKNPI